MSNNYVRQFSNSIPCISEKFPTSAIAVLRVNGDWKDLQLEQAALIGFHVPR